MFYHSAKVANRSPFLWASIGLGLYFILGLFFLLITEYFLGMRNMTVEVAIQKEPTKILFSAISTVIIIAISYIIQKNLITKKNENDSEPQKNIAQKI
jgi:ABC-type antimicrobial peptide transport system permease subunit